MSEAVTVPPGLLMRTTTALILSSFEALVSSSLNVANMLGCGTMPSLSCELMTPDRSSNRIFPAPVPLSCTSCTGPDGSMRLTVMQPACRLSRRLKKARLLTRPTPAHQDAPFAHRIGLGERKNSYSDSDLRESSFVR